MTMAKIRKGRNWEYDTYGLRSVTFDYIDILTAESPAGEIPVSTAPDIGDACPCDASLTATSRKLAEGRDNDSRVLVTSVTFERASTVDGTTPTTETETGDDYQCDEWGWDSSTEERELLTTYASGDEGPKPVCNSAGDPFDTAPKTSVFAPVFTKVMKFETRKNIMGYNCKTNANDIVIGSLNCPAHTLLCSVAEKRIFGGGKWNYAYTVQLRFKSNFVKIWGETEPIQIGWDIAVVDAGMRAKYLGDDGEEHLQLITVLDRETRKRCVVTSPALLDGNGYPISETEVDPQPRNLLFHAYEDTTFPAWFYDEPDIEDDSTGDE